MKWVKLKSPFFLDLRKQNRPELKPLRHTQSKWPCLTPSSWWFSMALASRGRVSCASSLRPFIQLLGNYGIPYTEADSKRGTKLRRESRTNCLRKCRNKVQRLQRNELWRGNSCYDSQSPSHQAEAKLKVSRVRVLCSTLLSFDTYTTHLESTIPHEGAKDIFKAINKRRGSSKLPGKHLTPYI